VVVVAPPAPLEDPALGRRRALLVLTGIAVGAELELLLGEPRRPPLLPQHLAGLGAGVAGPGELVAWRVPGRQAEVLPAPALEQMPGQIALVKALHDDDLDPGLGVV
jgi:hypothetical protein